MSERKLNNQRLTDIILMVEKRLAVIEPIAPPYRLYGEVKEKATKLVVSNMVYEKYYEPFKKIINDFTELESRYKTMCEEIENRRSQQQPKSELQIKLPDQEGQSTFKLSRGGGRAGSGRKKKEGVENRKVSLSLPAEWWQEIDLLKKHSKLSQLDVLHNLLIPILAITTSAHNMDFIKSEAGVMTALENYFGKKG
jgi:hypothetical protein